MPRPKRYRDSNTPAITSIFTPATATTPTPTSSPDSPNAHAQQQETTPLASNLTNSSIPIDRQSNRYWTVDVINGEGVVKKAQLKVLDIWVMPTGQRIVLHFNQSGQPIGEAAGILGGFIGAVASDVRLFPISYQNWRKVPTSEKEKCYKEIIKEKFHFQDDVGKRWILGSIAKHWRDHRSYLFKEFYKQDQSREDNILAHPGWIPQDMWKAFIDYRLHPNTMKMVETNIANRKKLVTPHTGGTKSFARKRHEMETMIGKPISRGALYIEMHKRADGSYVNDEARIISKKISTLESQKDLSSIIGHQDSLAQVLGPEYSGRVRGLGFGPTPSQIFNLTTQRSSKINLAPDVGGSVSTERMAQLESQLQSKDKRIKTLENFMQYMFKGFFKDAPVPPEFASLINSGENAGDAHPLSSSSHSSNSYRTD